MTTPRAHLPNTYTAPPGQWYYRVPETGYVTPKQSNWPQLLEHLTAHYKASGYKLPDDIFEKVEDHICANAPDYCEGGAPTRPRFDLAHTFTNVTTFSRTMATWFAGGRRYVEQEVANTRAAICAGCVYNLEPDGCTGCNSKTLTEIVQLIVGKRSTSHDASLKSCRICACLLQSKVHLPLDVLVNNMPSKQLDALPSHCWLVKERTSQELAT